MQPGCAEGGRIVRQFVAALRARRQPPERRFGGQHAGLHGAVAALDARHIEEPRLAADQRAAGKHELRQRLYPALVHRPGPVGDALPALEDGADLRMRLVALEFLERAEPRIAVIEGDDEPDRHLPPRQMVEEGPAIGAPVHRPAGGMDHQPRFMDRRIDIPQLLEADAVGLRLAALPEVEAVHQLLAERAPGSPRRTACIWRAIRCRARAPPWVRRRGRCPYRPSPRRPPPRLRGKALRRRRTPDRFPPRAPRPARPSSGRHCRG